MTAGPTTPIVFYANKNSRRSMVTPIQVVEMRELHGMGASYKALSERYGVTEACVGGIITRKSWRHLP